MTTREAREPLYAVAADAILARHAARALPDEVQLLAEHDARADAEAAVDAVVAALRDLQRLARRAVKRRR